MNKEEFVSLQHMVTMANKEFLLDNPQSKTEIGLHLDMRSEGIMADGVSIDQVWRRLGSYWERSGRLFPAMLARQAAAKRKDQAATSRKQGRMQALANDEPRTASNCD